MKCYHLKYYRKVKVVGNVLKEDKRCKETEFMETIVAENLRQALEYWDRFLIDPDNQFIGIWAGEPVVAIRKEPQP